MNLIPFELKKSSLLVFLKIDSIFIFQLNEIIKIWLLQSSTGKILKKRPLKSELMKSRVPTSRKFSSSSSLPVPGCWREAQGRRTSQSCGGPRICILMRLTWIYMDLSLQLRCFFRDISPLYRWVFFFFALSFARYIVLDGTFLWTMCFLVVSWNRVNENIYEWVWERFVTAIFSETLM